MKQLAAVTIQFWFIKAPLQKCRSSFTIETIHGKLFIFASTILLSNVVSGAIGVRPQTNGTGVVMGAAVPSNERKLHSEFVNTMFEYSHLYNEYRYTFSPSISRPIPSIVLKAFEFMLRGDIPTGKLKFSLLSSKNLSIFSKMIFSDT